MAVDLGQMALADWDGLLAACLHARDFEGVAAGLAVMATYGYAREAEDLRRMLLASLLPEATP